MSPARTKAPDKPANKWNDIRLVKECLSGNEAAWSQLIDKYKALIYSIPVKYNLPPHEAADVFQATCVELLVRLPELREPRALPKWLMQVAHHECYRVKRLSQRVVSRDGEATPEPETPAIAESLVQQTQEEQMLREAMAVLTPQCRRLVEMLFFESPSRPYAQVAAELGLALGSIGFTRQKCIERLRRQLEELGFY
ncbi:MAG TPA: sigma-70 family RNA polymerase sigma factor [Candidatus Acidoferrales bacterium]|jgi:RNA polymerase sigma factor (sigma-70 family)|nr:sigma-70 family RNA polymerase sigma factor [Candidatus Acidoferrales bacterium]